MSTQVKPPGYTTGTWVIDTTHSEVSFLATFLGFAKVRGIFADFEGTIVLAENPLDSSVNAVIKTASVTTKNKRRDKHLRHDDFLNAEQFPTMTFTSTAVRTIADTYLIDGDLTIRAATKPVTLTLQPQGFDTAPDGTPLARFTATTQINGTDFGVTRGRTAPFVSDQDAITLTIQASKNN